MGLLRLIYFHLAVKLKDVNCLQDSYKAVLTLQFDFQDFRHNLYSKLCFAFHSELFAEIQHLLHFCRVLKLS